jgi:serine/threonine protein kinase
VGRRLRLLPLMATSTNLDALLSLVEAKPQLCSRFTNIRRISPNGGQGNFSLVFTAMDSLTKQTVALKLYRPDKRSDTYRWPCFQREVEILTKLQGKNDFIQLLSPIEEFTETISLGGFPFTFPFAFYALEHASGGDVETYLTLGSIDALEKLEIFHAMCRCMQKAHNLRIAHRDFKPSNFLRMSDGRVKLADFGTAREFSATSTPLLGMYNAPVGDRRYVAPELLVALHDQFPELSFFADFFAMGASLFELLTDTKLGPLIYNASVLAGLNSCISQPNGPLRRLAFESAIGDISNRNPMPRISSTGCRIPKSVMPLLQGLYESLSALDHMRIRTVS